MHCFDGACFVLWLALVKLNLASMINFVLAIGFSVDYSAHIAEAYSAHAVRAKAEQCKDDEFVAVEAYTEAAALALRDLGMSVLNGGISTMLAVVLLSASSYEGYR